MFSLPSHLADFYETYPEAVHQPIIGITANFVEGDAALRDRYYQSVVNAGGTPVRSLKPLSNLMHLENLFINNTNVKSLSPIENIVSLKQLKIYNTKVKNRTVESLQQKRLDLNIIYY